MNMQEDIVELNTLTLAKLFEKELIIPDYQRIYCWEEKQVYRLISDLTILETKVYHLGAIILHKNGNNNRYEIIDGQQRLVTLALILQTLGTENIKLLDQSFESEEANSHVSYNKYLIENYISKSFKLTPKNILDKLVFSVLILDNTSLDLAYTFFSNENSKGKSLTDYDLLKAHHLRFIQLPEQAKHMAQNWDDMLLSSENAYKNTENGSEKNYVMTFELYLFRLRKWLRKKTWWDNEKYKVKNEFETALIIPELPPFGEYLKYSEPIQGGAHFFIYADRFISIFENFATTPQFKAIHKLKGESHWWYRNVIEAFLFAYYVKFSSAYLSEALILITRIVSQFRYEVSRANYDKLLIKAGESEIIMMIDQASSPTFFLAESLSVIKTLFTDNEMKGIRSRYKNLINDILRRNNDTNGKSILASIQIEACSQIEL